MGTKGITDASHENHHDRDSNQLPPEHISILTADVTCSVFFTRSDWLVRVGKSFRCHGFTASIFDSNMAVLRL
jgi:hypothetical protein